MAKSILLNTTSRNIGDNVNNIRAYLMARIG
jgi:hypothetical protein